MPKHVVAKITNGSAREVAAELARAEGQLRNHPELELLVDLSELRFARPHTVCAVAAFSLELARRNKTTVRVRRPTDPSVERYLTRMDFYAQLQVKQSTVVGRHEPDGRFVALTRIEAATRARLLDGIEDCLRRDFGLLPGLWFTMAYVLSELADNFEVHSDASAAFLHVQSYENRLSIALVDRGVGIPTSLARNPTCSHMTKRELLLQATREGATSLPGLSPGMGLFMTSEVVRANGGSLDIISEGACLSAGGRGISVVEVPHWQGTLIAIEFKKQVDTRVWDMFPTVVGPDELYDEGWDEVWE